jgi:hypothetical protein
MILDDNKNNLQTLANKNIVKQKYFIKYYLTPDSKSDKSISSKNGFLCFSSIN